MPRDVWVKKTICGRMYVARIAVSVVNAEEAVPNKSTYWGGAKQDILLAALVGCMIAKSINRTFSQKAAESILMIC